MFSRSTILCHDKFDSVFLCKWDRSKGDRIELPIIAVAFSAHLRSPGEAQAWISCPRGPRKTNEIDSSLLAQKFCKTSHLRVLNMLLAVLCTPLVCSLGVGDSRNPGCCFRMRGAPVTGRPSIRQFARGGLGASVQTWSIFRERSSRSTIYGTKTLQNALQMLRNLIQAFMQHFRGLQPKCTVLPLNGPLSVVRGLRFAQLRNRFLSYAEN